MLCHAGCVSVVVCVCRVCCVMCVVLVLLYVYARLCCVMCVVSCVCRVVVDECVVRDVCVDVHGTRSLYSKLHSVCSHWQGLEEYGCTINQSKTKINFVPRFVMRACAYSNTNTTRMTQHTLHTHTTTLTQPA